MTENKYLRIVYWALFYGLGLVFIIALVTDAMSHPHNGGAPRLVGLIIIGAMALVWIRLTTMGKEALREMG